MTDDVSGWEAHGVPAWLWRGVLDALDEGVLVLGPGGVLVDVSSRVVEALGVQRAEVIGAVLPESLSHPRRPARRALAGEPFDVEILDKRTLLDGEAVLRTRTRLAGGVAVQVVRDLTPQLAAQRAAQREAAEIDDLNRELVQLVGRISAARAVERDEIARLLRRDVLSELKALSSVVGARSAAARDAITGCIDALERMEIGLHSPVLERHGLVAALAVLAEQAATPCELVVTAGQLAHAQDRRYRDAASVVVWQNAREALRNVDAHAGATRCTVELEERRGWLWCTVRDDGRGVAPGVLEAAAASGHFGVLTMREAAEAAGGELTITDLAGRGCEVRFGVPLGGG